MASSDWWEHLRSEYRAKTAPTYTADQIAAVVKAVKAMPAAKKDPNKVATLWPQPKVMPTISDVDFGNVEFAQPSLKSLMASNKYLKRDRLIWHVQNPGKALHNNPFTAAPLVCTVQEGAVIIDGHHRLAALQLLGATKTQVYNLPLT